MNNKDLWGILKTVLWWTWTAAFLAGLGLESTVENLNQAVANVSKRLKLDTQVASAWASVLRMRWARAQEAEEKNLAEESDDVHGRTLDAAEAAGVLRGMKGGGVNVAEAAHKKVAAAVAAVAKAKSGDPSARGRGSSNRQRQLRRQFFEEDDADCGESWKWQVPQAAWDRLCRDTLRSLCPETTLRLAPGAASLLLVAATNVMVQVMADGKALQDHARRTTLFPQDLQLVLSLRRSWGDLTLAPGRKVADEAAIRASTVLAHERVSGFGVLRLVAHAAPE
ncbi:unnamed protein product [Symbiodinium natans]|uniref:Histone H2A/H2B/H3 domain-containing protein n=1 Tax=Symbiodinium natans TaxID=878477 RepID=A0A812MGZ1_9DINO|nr:unnamed protein product [Symbiodinium natans]